ncbi:MAG: hypothetical protein IJT44_01645 [Clostridia bacterium]|nr:hypothetical protein [Clostridia bacterium]
MKKPMTGKTRVALGILIGVLLIGICFFCVSLYAKKEFNKPKFQIPDPPAHDDLTQRLTTKEEAAAFIERLYAAAANADDAEGSWHTEVSFDGEWQTPFSDADNEVLRFFAGSAENEIGAFYPSVSDTLMTQAQDAPSPLTDAAVLSFELQQEEGRDRREDPYVIELTRDAAPIDTDRMAHSGVFSAIAEKIASVAEIETIAIDALGVRERYRLDHARDQLLSAELRHEYRIRVRVRLTSPLAEPSKTVEIELPYTTVQHVAFRYYGVRFTGGGVVARTGSKLGLDAEVTVRDGDTEPEDYVLRFTSSAPDVLAFDETHVMTPLKDCADPITVTITMEYAGHTYTDETTVYITDLEVADDA